MAVAIDSPNITIDDVEGFHWNNDGPRYQVWVEVDIDINWDNKSFGVPMEREF